MSRVLFVCVHNAGRSQMSQALFNRAAGDRHEARSAGQSLEAVRATRDEIDRRITGLLAELAA